MRMIRININQCDLAKEGVFAQVRAVGGEEECESMAESGEGGRGKGEEGIEGWRSEARGWDGGGEEEAGIVKRGEEEEVVAEASGGEGGGVFGGCADAEGKVGEGEIGVRGDGEPGSHGGRSFRWSIGGMWKVWLKFSRYSWWV